MFIFQTLQNIFNKCQEDILKRYFNYELQTKKKTKPHKFDVI